jgi:hypothetical protein
MLIFLPWTLEIWIISIQPLRANVSRWLKITHVNDRSIFGHDEDDVSGSWSKDDPSFSCFKYIRTAPSSEMTLQRSQQNALENPGPLEFR